LLEQLNGLRVGVDIDVGVADPVAGKELLHPFAVRAPSGPIDGEGRVMGSGGRLSHTPSVTPPPRPARLAQPGKQTPPSCRLRSGAGSGRRDLGCQILHVPLY